MLLALIILYVVSLVSLSVTERFRHYALFVGAQGWLLVAIALLRLHGVSLPELLFVLSETLVVKALIIPAILLRIIRRTGINRVHAESMAIFNQLLISVFLLICSIVVTYYIAAPEMDVIFFCVSLYALLSGMMLIITHKRIFSHLVGFLVIENGVFLFSMAIGVEMPFLINIAILIDILMSVLMLGLFISKIGDRLHDLSADTLTAIKD